METGSSKKLNWFQARSPFVVSLSCVLAAGLFIWYKLRLVTGMPRSAYAVPEVQQEKVAPAADEPAADAASKKPSPDDSPAH